MTERRYLIVIEGAEGESFSAYAPDPPGCVASGATREVVEREMHDAIGFHLEGLGDAGEPMPEPSDLTTAYVDVVARAGTPVRRPVRRLSDRSDARTTSTTPPMTRRGLPHLVGQAWPGLVA